MFIKTLGREITIGAYTRGIARQVSEKALEGVNVNAADIANMQMPAINAELSDQLQISLLTGLSRDVLDTLEIEEYDEIKKAVDAVVKKKTPTKK